jgi:PPOX class probable F420-dependent enzyme
MPLPDDVTALLKRRAICYLATTMPDGSPQVTLTWADTDGEHVLINTVVGHQKTRNIERDPRVSVALSDPSDPTRYTQIRGSVVETTTEGAVDHIEELSQRYTDGPYAWWGGRDQQRVILKIAPRNAQVSG